jgi:hypothetical protein
MRSSQAARGGRAVTVGLKSSGNTKGRRRTLGGGRRIKIQCRRRVCKVYQVKRQRVSWAMGECWMVTVNAGKRTEDDSVESGEWRVERGVSRGGRTQECAGVSRGTDLLRGLPNQRLCGGVAGEVVIEERASGKRQVKREGTRACTRVIGWRASVIGKLRLDPYVRSSAARSAMQPCRSSPGKSHGPA